MANNSGNERTIFSYVINYNEVKAERPNGCFYEINNLSSCIVDYNSNTIVDRYEKKISSNGSNLEELYNEFKGFYEKYEDNLIFKKKPFVMNKYFNYILIKTFLNKELINDENDFVFSLDCFDILDMYKMYSFCKTGKIVETELKNMLIDFGIVAQEKEGNNFFELINSSRLSVQMMKKIGLIFLMSDMGGAKL